MLAAPMWTADADARVLSVVARATTAPSGMDLHHFDHHIVADRTGQHVRLVVHGEIFRLDVVSGTILLGPVHLTYLLAQGGRLGQQIDTVRRLEQRFAGINVGCVEGASRIARSAMALRARDARSQGASLKEIATVLLGDGEWPGPGDFRKSATRRLVSAGERLVRQGPLPVLNW